MTHKYNSQIIFWIQSEALHVLQSSKILPYNMNDKFIELLYPTNNGFNYS